MRLRRKAIIYGISMVMALTCFAPVTEIAFATDDQQTQTTQPTKAPAAKNGWQGKYYYQKGKVVKGIRKIGKTWYEFDKKSGKLKRKIGDDMDKKAQKYKSKRKWLVLVDKSRHQVRIYKGKKNKWKLMKNARCTVGAKGTRTPSGTFRITRKGRYFNTGSNLRCWYWTGFIGSEYLFHSVLYNRNGSPTRIVNGTLGKNLSHGCIRLSLSNARYLQKKVPGGSKVVIKNKF